ncbi:hypothetical protein AQUCO_06000057v1 [Aquilegia coerulea]|uniref:Uncharacterized protein n=1 Tax=Aquilegia coerulea TaxID=218851 RepID=A0A2G5CDU0_AQUCA|nr:hypothetical protein AQUCO_06000057v1 [Aquilegia coerulea]
MNFPQLILLLLLLLPHLFFTIASSPFKVKTLPGFDGLLPFQLETGYISVDESDGVQLFYYFIESERNPKEDPLIFWLSGGPGCSSFTGLAYEIGPILFNIVEYNGSLPTFYSNPYAWTKVSNIVFLDQPVGSGFSYSTSSHGWNSSDTKSAKQTYKFLKKWLDNHPQFSKHPVYIGGDSYAGMVVPIIVQEIATGIMMQHKPVINLEGYILGNPVTDAKFDKNSKIPFSHRMALISDELYKLTKRNCKGEYVMVDSRNIKCLKNLQTVSECTKDLKVEHVLERNCIFVLANKPSEIQGNRRSLGQNFENFGFESQLPEFGCRNYNYLLSYYWANDDNVRSALHIKKGTTKTWIRCNNQGGLPYKKDVDSTLIYHQNLSKRGYRSLIYSGDHDLLTPYLGTQAWIKSLNYSIIDDWRPWFVQDQVAGYTRTYSNGMTFATVKGAGHTAPEYMPKECLPMFSSCSSLVMRSG